MKSRMSIQHMAAIAVAAAAMAAALPLRFASAFSPSSVAGVKCGAASSKALGYKSYGYDYDPHLYDVGERVALAEPTRKPTAPTSREPRRQTPRRKQRRGERGNGPRLHDVKRNHRSVAPAIDNGASGSDTTHRDEGGHGDQGHGSGGHLYDAESDRTSSLRILLEPPAPPLPPPKPASAALQTPEQRQASLRAASRGRASSAARQRPASPIVSLRTVQDYRDHVLHPDNAHELCVVRFKAPWCQTCRTTGVAWERMASRLARASRSSPGGKVKFLSVELDGTEGTAALKELLGIEGVPQGVLHRPALGITEEKVKLARPQLSVLKRNLERYCTFTRGEDGLQRGMLLDGLREG